MKWALAAGILGAALCVLGIFVAPRQAAFSYLAAWVFWLTVVLGALSLTMMAHITHARWFVLVRRLTESISATLPLFALLFVPVALSLTTLYPWADLEHASEKVREAVEQKHAYLNPLGFYVRGAVYFALWIAFAELLRRWSVRQDRDADAKLTGRARALSAAAIAPLFLALTFASFDWLMSLDPTWSSTAFGLYVFSGGFVGALAALALLAWALERRGALPETVSPSHYFAIGKLLLAFVIFWAYIAYTQFFIIWIADLPAEVTFYQRRAQGSWAWVSAFLGLGHFALPFLLLLSRELKRRPRRLAAVGVFVLAAHYVDVHWLALPSLHPEGFRPHWLDLAALLAVGGLALAFALVRQRGTAIVPRNDPEFAASLRWEDA